MSLKGSKTEENLKAAFAGESQANRRYLYFAQKADVEGHNDVAAVLGQRQREKPDMLMDTWNFLKKSGIPQLVNQLGTHQITLRQQLLAKLMNTLICILEWQRLLAMRVLKKSRIGLRRLLRQKSLMLVNFKEP